MKSEMQNSTLVEQDATQPNPPPPQFDEAMIAAAKPVEPLGPNQGTQQRQPMMQFLKGRWGLIGAVLIVALLSVVLFGMMSEQVVSQPPEESTQPLPAEASIGPAVVNQSVEEGSRATIATSSVKSSAKVRDNNRPRYRRPMEWLPTKPDSPQASERPVARKVGEIYFGRGKQDRGREASPRRRDDNDNR